MSNLNGSSANGSNRLQHAEIEGLLAAYIAGELDEETEHAAVERHIAGCAICQQTLMETSRIFTVLNTLSSPSTPTLHDGTTKQPSSLADRVMAQLAPGKPVDDNETIEAFARPLSTFPGVVDTEKDFDVFPAIKEGNSLSPWLRKREPHIQQESGRNMKNFSIAPRRHAKSRPYTWLITIAATILVLLVVGSSLTVLIRMAQHTTNGVPPSSKTGHSSIVSVTPTATPKNVRERASALVKQFHQEVATWGTAHLYHDSFDGHAYQLDNAYGQAGLGGILDNQLAQAQNDADFQSVIDEANNALFNLHMLEADAADATPFNQSHHSDLQLLNHYQLKGQVVVVSLAGQAMRVYQNGQLVKAFLISSGQPKVPSLPVVTQELNRMSPTTFKSSVPKGDPDWYPDTPIMYAIEYHTAGYYLHDAWWQTNFGPETQFPHQNNGGVQNSTGGINLATNDAKWVYDNTNLKTTIVIY